MESFQLPTLLIVSDNPPVRFWLKKRLETKFYIVEATQTYKAVEVVKNTRLDFIIVDSLIDESDSLEVCQKMRQHNLVTPIFLITGRLKKSFRKSAHDAGVTDFLFEQLDEEELEMRIATGLKTAEARHKVAGLSDRIPTAKPQESDYFKNKFFLQTRALQLLANAREHNLPITIVIVRIDKYSDAHKEILLPFSEFLNQSVTEKDLVIPIQEGQFILLLSKTLEEGEKSAQEIRKKIEHHRFGPLHVTATFAISDLEAGEKSFNEMIDSTVKALKQSSAVTNTILSIEKRTL